MNMDADDIVLERPIVATLVVALVAAGLSTRRGV